ncbi:hypothetical protein CDL12_09085 [Handroanthus impetiginosus]|uniref:Uncharacterized protein n=1 Tax=Handroanthus impetiginosus TaxID=429701 RepID=A0A2G9HL55_9LAMI|nr:hypothetical protein CDL12_09085 [Handroanthus impetiginosus]
MGWLHSFLSPLKKFLGRLRAAKRTRNFNQNCRGIYVLYEDVKSCSCEDVHALWTLLVDSDAKLS